MTGVCCGRGILIKARRNVSTKAQCSSDPRPLFCAQQPAVTTFFTVGGVVVLGCPHGSVQVVHEAIVGGVPVDDLKILVLRVIFPASVVVVVVVFFNFKINDVTILLVEFLAPLMCMVVITISCVLAITPMTTCGDDSYHCVPTVGALPPTSSPSVRCISGHMDDRSACHLNRSRRRRLYVECDANAGVEAGCGKRCSGWVCGRRRGSGSSDRAWSIVEVAIFGYVSAPRNFMHHE